MTDRRYCVRIPVTFDAIVSHDMDVFLLPFNSTTTLCMMIQWFRAQDPVEKKGGGVLLLQ